MGPQSGASVPQVLQGNDASRAAPSMPGNGVGQGATSTVQKETTSNGERGWVQKPQETRWMTGRSGWNGDNAIQLHVPSASVEALQVHGWKGWYSICSLSKRIICGCPV